MVVRYCILCYLARVRRKFLILSGFTLFFGIWTLPQVLAYVDVDLRALASVESSNNPSAISFLGARFGRGLYQVSEVALLDFNRSNHTSIKPDQLFDPETCRTVASWHLKKRIPQLLKKSSPTLEELLTAYNKGWVYAKRKDWASDYIRRYQDALLQGEVDGGAR